MKKEQKTVMLPSADIRLPNGYGSIKKGSGKRRYPYLVYVPDGKRKDKHGRVKVKYKYIGKTETKEEGIILLNRYHNTNELCFYLQPTFEDVYNMWYNTKFCNNPMSIETDYIAAFKTCHKIHSKTFIYLKTSDLQDVIDTCGKNYPTLRKLASLLRHLYRYAMSNDLCEKNYAQYIDIKKYKNRNSNSRPKEVFTHEEIDLLWLGADNEYYQMILILIYTGVRIGELLEVKKENVHLEEQYFDVRKSKTYYGIRKVPIADKLVPFFENWLNKNESEYLFTSFNNEPFQYRNYFDSYFKVIMKMNGMDRRPHECRHTFISLMAKANINPTIIKMIVGHSRAMSITESVYTHFDVQTLVDAVNQIV